MIFKSKLDTFVSQYIGSLREKSIFFQKNFPSMLALLLSGFLVGNVFGTFLNTLRFLFLWDVFIIFILIGLLEILNYTVYHAKNRLVFLGPFFGWPQRGRTRAKLSPEGRLPKAELERSSRPKGGCRKIVPAKVFVQFLNFFKIGLMIGFFVDAFKVGS